MLRFVRESNNDNDDEIREEFYMVIALEEFIVGEENPDDILGPRDAAAYLGKLWERPFTAKDFNNLFTNRGDEITVEPVYKTSNITMWRRADLAIIAKTVVPPRYREEVRKPRPLRRKPKEIEG